MDKKLKTCYEEMVEIVDEFTTKYNELKTMLKKADDDEYDFIDKQMKELFKKTDDMLDYLMYHPLNKNVNKTEKLYDKFVEVIYGKK